MYFPGRVEYITACGSESRTGEEADDFDVMKFVILRLSATGDPGTGHQNKGSSFEFLFNFSTKVGQWSMKFPISPGPERRVEFFLTVLKFEQHATRNFYYGYNLKFPDYRVGSEN